MQIRDLYQTKITCSTYNATIDSTDTVITVKLTDFNGNAVTGKSVTLTCDKGYFNKNGSTSISGNTTKSITATTDSSGEITATWTASEWGLCTFSTNNISNQVKVKGWKLMDSGTGYTIYRNDLIGLINIAGNFAFGALNSEKTICTLPSNAQTASFHIVKISHDVSSHLIINSWNQNVTIKVESDANSNPYCVTSCFYRIKE